MVHRVSKFPVLGTFQSFTPSKRHYRTFYHYVRFMFVICLLGTLLTFSFEFFMRSNIYLLLGIPFRLYTSFVHLHCCKSVCNLLANQTCPQVTIDSTIPSKDLVRYLGRTLDRRLTWKKYISKLKKFHWLTGGRSKLKIQNKITRQDRNETCLDLRNPTMGNSK